MKVVMMFVTMSVFFNCFAEPLRYCLEEAEEAAMMKVQDAITAMDNGEKLVSEKKFSYVISVVARDAIYDFTVSGTRDSKTGICHVKKIKDGIVSPNSKIILHKIP